MSNEEKANDCENFEKGMIYMKILKKGGSREKGGGGNEIHAPSTCVPRHKFVTGATLLQLVKIYRKVVSVMVFNATFNNISFITCMAVSFVGRGE